jgi:hypothetical protein
MGEWSRFSGLLKQEDQPPSMAIHSALDPQKAVALYKPFLL